MSLQGTSGKAAGGLLAAAAAAVGVTASLGAGYTVAHAALADGSAYVAKGTALAHVNGEARKTDAVGRALAKQGEGLDVVALPGNRVAVINRKTNTITTVDGATMTPTATVRPKTAGSVLVVSSGHGGWLVSHDARTATPLRDGRPGRPVGLPGAPADAAPAPNGGLFVLADDGKLARVDANGSVHAVPTDAAPRGALTVAGGSAYLVTVDGAVLRLDRSTPEVVATVSGLAPGPDGRMVVGALTSDGPHVLVVSPDGLAIVDPDTGRAPFRVLHAPGDALGRPVEYKGRAYVPDYDAHQVLVVDIATQRVLKPLKVPGSEQSFALFVSGGRLWANDQYAQHLLEVDGASPHTVDKGPGNGVSDDRRRGAASPGRGVAPPGGGTVPRNAPPVGRGTLPPVSSPVGPPAVGTPPVQGSPKGSGPGGSTNPRAPVKRVTVPLFPPHTNYVDACARIEALGPTCQPVSGGTDTDGDTGDVIATIPAGGSQIAVTEHVVVSYVGPVTVPALPDNVPPTPADVCLAVEAAKLRCDPEPASSPARSAAQFGLVADLDPAAGSEADKGATVTVHYYDTFPMPDAVAAAQPGQSLCTQLGALVVELPNRQLHPACTAPAGDQPTNDRAKIGITYQQDPAAGTAVHADDRIILTVYDGRWTLPDYGNQRENATGLPITTDAAMADCQRAFACQVQDGSPAVGHPEWIGRVQGTDQTPNQAYDVGTQIVIRRWSGQNTVPDVTGQSTAGGAGSPACQTLAAAGFGCDVNSSHPMVPVDDQHINTANPRGIASSPAAGQTAALGTTVVVPNTPWPVYPLYKYTNNSDGKVHVVRLNSGPPNGYGNQQLLGYAYGLNSNIPTGARTPQSLLCTSSAANCNGHAPNHMYTSVGIAYVNQHDSPQWTVGGPIADLIPTGNGCGAGQTVVARVWQFNGNTHDYDVVTGSGQELLGCVWTSVN